MANASGQDIESIDYNFIRNKIIQVMGIGISQSGYGQTIYSSDVAPLQEITAQQWNLLRFDIFNARVHQDGTTPSIVQASQGAVITFGSAHPNNQYNIQADLAVANKFNVGAGQFVIDAGISQTRTTVWNTSVSCTCTVTFGTSDQARWFFNSGGKIRFTSNRVGGTASPQNSSWSSLLNGAGTVEFGGISPSLVNFYSLTNSPQIFFTSGSSGVYSGNNYRITAQSNVVNNSNGGATVLQFTATWQDAYSFTGPSAFPDNVDGTLSWIVDELRAAGALQNGTQSPGTFSISRPSYSITSITGN